MGRCRDRGVLAIDDVQSTVGILDHHRQFELVPIPIADDLTDQPDRGLATGTALVGIIDHQLGRIDPADIGLGRRDIPGDEIAETGKWGDLA